MSTMFWRGWRFWILGCCVLLPVLFGLVWGLLPHRPAQGATPLQHSCLKVDMEHRDLGVVYPGDEVQLQYHLENTGESELTISDLSSSCGCAPATIDTTTIPFGGEATIKVHFQTPLAAGTVGHAVRFHTNDPDHENMSLTFQVLARRPIEAAPPNLFTGAIICGTDVSHELELCSTDGTPFQVEKYSTSAPWMHVERLDPVSHRHMFRLTIDGHAPMGAFAESAEFITTCPRQARVVVPIRGEIVSAFAFSPASLLLRSAPPRSIVDAKLLIASPPKADYALQSVDIQDKGWQVVSWKIERISATKMCLCLRVRVPSAGYQRTSLILKPAASELTQQIPLSCMVAETKNAKP